MPPVCERRRTEMSKNSQFSMLSKINKESIELRTTERMILQTMTLTSNSTTLGRAMSSATPSAVNSVTVAKFPKENLPLVQSSKARPTTTSATALLFQPLKTLTSVQSPTQRSYSAATLALCGWLVLSYWSVAST